MFRRVLSTPSHEKGILHPGTDLRLWLDIVVELYSNVQASDLASTRIRFPEPSYERIILGWMEHARCFEAQ
jgi:hypothetical protein